MRAPENSDFCYYPFFQILLSADGRYKPCSKHRDVITHEGKELNVRNATLEDAWNSDYMQRMRDDFHNNRKFPGCSECWRMQKMGLRSMRYDSYEYSITEQQVAHPVSPVRIELNSSNVCNLRCRICSPNASTKWISEFREFYGRKEDTHINLTGENLAQVKEWADNLQEICFFGGEPLLSEANLDLMRYLIQRGVAGNIALLFNTNGTVFNDEIADILSQFRWVRMSFSVDDIGKRFEYQRSGARWNEVNVNLTKAYELSKTEKWKNMQLRVCNTLSVFNVYYMPEFFNYFNAHYPGLHIYWNLIYHPWEFSMQILPREVKQVVRKRLETEIKTTFILTESETKTVADLVTYLEHDEQKDFGEFFRMVNRHDVYRGESFPEVFPEFWDIIRPYKPKELVMGEYDPMDPRFEDYQPETNYRARLAERLRKYLLLRHAPAETDALLQEFFEKVKKSLALSPAAHENRVYHVMMESRIDEVFNDVRDMNDAEIAQRLKLRQLA